MVIPGRITSATHGDLNVWIGFEVRAFHELWDASRLPAKPWQDKRIQDPADVTALDMNAIRREG